jgi:hypothetical protein
MPVSLSYSHQGQELPDHVAELRKQSQVGPESPHFWVQVTSSVSCRSARVHGQDPDESRLGASFCDEQPEDDELNPREAVVFEARPAVRTSVSGLEPAAVVTWLNLA